MNDIPDRYPTTRTATCDKGHEFRQTLDPGRGYHVPQTCPMCDFETRRAELERVLKKNSDLKGT